MGANRSICVSRLELLLCSWTSLVCSGMGSQLSCPHCQADIMQLYPSSLVQPWMNAMLTVCTSHHGHFMPWSSNNVGCSEALTSLIAALYTLSCAQCKPSQVLLFPELAEQDTCQAPGGEPGIPARDVPSVDRHTLVVSRARCAHMPAQPGRHPCQVEQSHTPSVVVVVAQ